MGFERQFTEKTGLLLDPYFSGTKIAWLLDNVKGAREKAEKGELAFGTIDSFLIWRLTGGKVHATDATNASRTLLYDIHTGEWDESLLRILNVPRKPAAGGEGLRRRFRRDRCKAPGRAIPICGVAGDQQAATSAGLLRARHDEIDLWHRLLRAAEHGRQGVASQNRLLTTVAYQLDGKRTYALEGAIFIAGAGVQWLRDGLKLVKTAGESGALAKGGRYPTSRSISCRPSSASARPTGMPMCAARSSASRAARRTRKSRRPRWKPCATRRAIFWRRCRRTGARREKPSSASTAA
jgi:glycerol kinase